MGTWRSTRCVRKWRSTKTSRLCRPRSHSSSRVHMFLEARRGAVLPRRVPSRTSSVVLVDALRQRTSPRCLARTPAPCEQARPSSSVLCDRAGNSGSYVPVGRLGTSHWPCRRTTITWPIDSPHAVQQGAGHLAFTAAPSAATPIAIISQEKVCTHQVAANAAELVPTETARRKAHSAAEALLLGVPRHFQVFSSTFRDVIHRSLRSFLLRGFPFMNKVVPLAEAVADATQQQQ